MVWTCSKCSKKRWRDLSPYTWKLFRIRRLQMAGYPLEKNDLTYAEWCDLGRLAEVIEYGQR